MELNIPNSNSYPNVCFFGQILGSIPTFVTTFGQGSGPIHFNQMGCTGNEARLAHCPSGSTSGCSHAHDVGVRCHMQTGNVRN